MLPCVCSVIGCQNVVRTSVTHSAWSPRVPLFLFLPQFDVICDEKKPFDEICCLYSHSLEKSTHFLSSEQPCGPKSLNVSLNIAGVERIRSKNMRLRSTLDALCSSLKWKEGYRQWKFVSSVVNDSQINLTWYRRHLMPAIQLAASCGGLYFSRCCALKRTGTFASESKVTCLF